MIVSCPSCSKRYNLGDHGRSSQALTITCRGCGHRWQEHPMIEVIDVPHRSVARIVDVHDEPELDVQRLVEAARSAHEEFAGQRKARFRKTLGWASLCFTVLTPLMIAAMVPEAVVAAAPATIRAYDRLGYSVNIYGLEIRHIEQQHSFVDGERVLMIKGEISNPTNDIRKIPWMRFGLKGQQNQELYHWTLDTGSRPLRPGETTSFVTRVASPPELAQNLQIRFAHDDEIGSNTKP
jgi:zinc-ribbon domain